MFVYSSSNIVICHFCHELEISGNCLECVFTDSEI